MKGITIKLPEATLLALAIEAKASGCSVAAVVRSRLETRGAASGGSFYAQAKDLAGVLEGGRTPAGNERRKFRRA